MKKPNPSIFETIRRISNELKSIPKPISWGLGAVALLGVVYASNNDSLSAVDARMPASTAAPRVDYDSKALVPSFDFEIDGIVYEVACEGLETKEAKAGDTLGELVLGIDVTQVGPQLPSRIPRAELIDIVAKINGIPDPDKISEGEEYVFPESCAVFGTYLATGA